MNSDEKNILKKIPTIIFNNYLNNDWINTIFDSNIHLGLFLSVRPIPAIPEWGNMDAFAACINLLSSIARISGDLKTPSEQSNDIINHLLAERYGINNYDITHYELIKDKAKILSKSSSDAISKYMSYIFNTIRDHIITLFNRNTPKYKIYYQFNYETRNKEIYIDEIQSFKPSFLIIGLNRQYDIKFKNYITVGIIYASDILVERIDINLLKTIGNEHGWVFNFGTRKDILIYLDKNKTLYKRNDGKHLDDSEKFEVKGDYIYHYIQKYNYICYFPCHRVIIFYDNNTCCSYAQECENLTITSEFSACKTLSPNKDNGYNVIDCKYSIGVADCPTYRACEVLQYRYKKQNY